MSFDPRTTPARHDVAAAHLRGSVTAQKFVEGRKMMVGAASTPLRIAAEATARLGSELLFGEEFTVYDEARDWAWGQAARDSYVGYVESRALRPPGRPATHRVQVLRGLVFPAPDLKRPVTAALALNARVCVLGEDREFLEVESLGWMSKRHLAPLDAIAADFVAVAERLLGAPYLWGGRTQEGLDCSGLVQTAFEAAGRIVPRDTDLIERFFKDEVLLPLRRGDLIFWRGHLGIMVDPHRLIHANATHMAVTIEPLNDVIARQETLGETITRMARPAQ